jgi:hypothetical protein
MTSSCSSPARSAPRRAARYVPPTPLQDLHILDLLELAGSQYQAGAALAVHQSTVSRSVQLMRQQFRLVPAEGSAATCRYGHNTCLQYLRLAYREHRLMEGLLRIGTDPLHQSLLQGLEVVQQVPPRFRHGHRWAELVRLGLLDGAIVSSFSLGGPLPVDGRPTWDGLTALPLGQLHLQLVATAQRTRGVLLPRKLAAPGLHQTGKRLGWEVWEQPLACHEPAAWIKRAHDRQLAMPICAGLLDAAWLAAHKLVPLAQQPPLPERLWLLLPQGAVNSQAARLSLRVLRQLVAKSSARHEPLPLLRLKAVDDSP